MSGSVHQIELTGLDGSNPLAFLAALGILRTLDMESSDSKPKLAWSAQLHPVIVAAGAIASTLPEQLYRGIEQLVENGVASFGDIISVSVNEFRNFVEAQLAHPETEASRNRLIFASAFGSTAVIDAKKGTIIPTAISFSNGQGGKLLLKDFRTLCSRLTPEHIRAALFDPWQYQDEDQPTFRWDPLDMRTGAHMATDPGSTGTRSVMAANVLAFIGISFLIVAPADGGLQTTCFRAIGRESHLIWPIWKSALSSEVIGSLLQLDTDRWCDEIGIIFRFASKRIMYKKNLYLGGSFAF